VRAVVEALAPAIAAASADVRVEVAADQAVTCRPSLLRAVLLNVIGNAVKFVAGGELRLVTVTGTAEHSDVVLEVADTGQGIPEDAVERIFEAFYRVPGTDDAGHGIGLAIVRRLVAAYGGNIVVSSTVGEGSVFRIALPRRVGSAEAPSPGPGVIARPRPAGTLRPTA
jgi:signal transduction histidine kinase